MANLQRPGDFIPGIDSRTGEAKNFTRAEWINLVRDLTLSVDMYTGTTRAYDFKRTLCYEIYTSQLR